MTKQILICGDSFAADWRIEYPDAQGWPNLLATEYQINNLAQAGCSEYRILQQLRSADLTKYDLVIVSHTSPYRLYVKEHPVHHRSRLHANSDLIYNDIKEHAKDNPQLHSIVNYFEQYVDLDYQRDIHGLIYQEIAKLLSVANHVHITHSPWSIAEQPKNMLNFEKLHKQQPGLINHYSEQGNQKVFQKIKSYIDA